mgnify:CR=1 FL=1
MGNVNTSVYEDGEWIIELRPRNNSHEGEPDMKVWVMRNAREVAQFTDNYRGYGHYKDNESLLPDEIVAKAKNVWELLKTAPFSQELLEEIKTKINEA